MGLRATCNLGVPRAIPAIDAGPGEHAEPSLARGGGPRRPVVPSCPGGLIGRHVAPTTSGGLGNPCVLSLRSTAARAVRRKPPCAVRRSRLTHRKRQRARPPRAAVCLVSRDVARGVWASFRCLCDRRERPPALLLARALSARRGPVLRSQPRGPPPFPDSPPGLCVAFA